MTDVLSTALDGTAFIAAVDAAFARLAHGERRCAFVDPSGHRFWDVVVWQVSSIVFAFTRDGLSGTVTLEIGDAGLFIDDVGPVASVEVEGAAPGWMLLGAGGLEIGARSFEEVLPDAATLVAERFDVLFDGDDSALGSYRAARETEAMEDFARAEAIEQSALVEEQWIGGMRVRELRATPSVVELLDDAMPEPTPAHVWTVALPIGFIVCATRSQAVELATNWHGANDA